MRLVWNIRRTGHENLSSLLLGVWNVLFQQTATHCKYSFNKKTINLIDLASIIGSTSQVNWLHWSFLLQTWTWGRKVVMWWTLKGWKFHKRCGWIPLDTAFHISTFTIVNLWYRYWSPLTTKNRPVNVYTTTACK